MTKTEEINYIDNMHDRFYTPVDNDPEPKWCDNCGCDLPLDDLTTIYQIPGQIECYCEKCFAKVVFDDCIVTGNVDEDILIKSIFEEAMEKRRKRKAIIKKLLCTLDR